MGLKRALLHAVRLGVPEPVRGPLRAVMHWYRRQGRPAPLRVSHEGSRLVLQTADGLSIRLLPEARSDAEYQFWSDRSSALEMRDFLGVAKKCSLLYDVGAHYGVFSLVFCLTRSSNRAQAFEPSSASAAVAREHFGMNGLLDRARLREVALGDREGSAPALIDPRGFAHLGESVEGTALHELPMRTVDGEVLRNGESPDLLKVDVEGFELEVLRGASGLLQRDHPLVFLELHLDEIERRGGEPRLVLDELQSHGYRDFRVAGERWSAARICDATTPVVRLSATT